MLSCNSCFICDLLLLVCAAVILYLWHSRDICRLGRCSTVVAVLFRASLSIIFRSVSQNYSHYLQRKVHIKAVNIFDTSAQKMFILRDLYLFILKMYDIWYEQKRAASLKVLFPLVWTFWLHLLWIINLPYYELNCCTSINNFFELGRNKK